MIPFPLFPNCTTTAIVRESCEAMLCKNWMVSMSNSPVAVLRALDIDSAPETTEKAARVLAAQGAGRDAAFADFNELDCETALWWRALAEHSKEEKDDDRLEMLIPSISEFATIIRRFADLEAEVGSSLACCRSLLACTPHFTSPTHLSITPSPLPSQQADGDEALENNITLVNLIQMAASFDYTDEIGRRLVL